MLNISNIFIVCIYILTTIKKQIQLFNTVLCIITYNNTKKSRASVI